MAAPLAKLPALAAQMVRSAQTFVAFRQLNRGAARGVKVADNPALGQLARAMGLPPEQARQVWAGELRRGMSPDTYLKAARALRGASLVGRLLPGSRTGAKVDAAFTEVRQQTIATLQRTVAHKRGQVHGFTEAKRQASELRRRGQAGAAEQARRSSKAIGASLQRLSDDIAVLNRGIAARLVE